MALVLCGCATQSGATRDGVQIERDQFSSIITVVGPADSIDQLGETIREWSLKSRVDKKAHAVTTLLYVDITYVGSWRWYGVAADGTARDLTVYKIGSQAGTCFGAGVCSREEIIAVEVDGGTLRSRVQDGYPITFRAKSGDSLVVTVSPAQIHVQLAALAKLGVLPPAAPHGAKGGQARW